MVWWWEHCPSPQAPACMSRHTCAHRTAVRRQSQTIPSAARGRFGLATARDTVPRRPARPRSLTMRLPSDAASAVLPGWCGWLPYWRRAIGRRSFTISRTVRMTTERARPKRPITTHKISHSVISQPIRHIPVFVQRTIDDVQADCCSAVWQKNDRGGASERPHPPQQEAPRETRLLVGPA